MAEDSAILLIGHGRKAMDTPSGLLSEYRLAKASFDSAPERFKKVERQIRDWPRTAHNDPYQEGLQRIADALRGELQGARVAIAFNEFCAPSIEEAVATLARDGVRSVAVMTTMFTPGGNHAERDIPACLELLRTQFPKMSLQYLWPYPLGGIARFLADTISTKTHQ